MRGLKGVNGNAKVFRLAVRTTSRGIQTKVRVSDRWMLFRQKFRGQYDVVCLRDETSEIEIGVWLFQ